MAGISASPGSQEKTGAVPAIQRFTIALANTEEPITLPTGTYKIQLTNRGSVAVRIAYEATGTGILNKYVTRFPNACYEDTEIVSLTLYVQSSKAGHLLELVAWT